MARFPRHAGDRFWGGLNVIFFGLCAWVHALQAVGDRWIGVQLTSPQGRRFVLAGCVFGGLAMLSLALAEGGVSLIARGLIGGVGALVAMASLRGVIKAAGLARQGAVRDVRRANLAWGAPTAAIRHGEGLAPHRAVVTTPRECRKQGRCTPKAPPASN